MGSIKVNKVQILKDLMEKYGDEEHASIALVDLEQELMSELSYWFERIKETLNTEKFMPVIALGDVSMVGSVRIHGTNVIEAGFGSTDDARNTMLDLMATMVQQMSNREEGNE